MVQKRPNRGPAWRAQIQFQYGLTGEEWLAGRIGVCELCGRFSETLHADHNHDVPGKLRGWLCNRCNSGLGLFQDNPDLLRKASQYLANRGHVNKYG